ncbi:DNA translocase FtsK [Alteribacter natronophilus]|uniref:DNA translocase FtsK n=1 Tax=Alteribacter natronophilus TaxID=2583810 RepID=UPI00110ECF3E|nr:DNA translocase FtsK [Alteribacter natronophilus]TMW73265.1 DNA translocase FtsK [Alteribacter natronophilus]
MGKRKRKNTKWKTQLTYELAGVFLFVIATVAFARLGFAGEGIVQLFRFILGDWHILLTGSLLVLAFYFMIKRKWPSFWSRRKIGFYLFVFAVALLTHVRQFEVLSRETPFTDRSVIRNTWHIFFMQLNNESAVDTLGGGMVGALGFSMTHFLFAEGGTIAFAIGLMVASVILFTGRSVMDVLKKGFDKAASGVKKTLTAMGAWTIEMFSSMKEAINEKRQAMKQEARARKQNHQPSENGAKEPAVPAQKHEDNGVEDEEPVIYDFSTKAYQEETSDGEQNSARTPGPTDTYGEPELNKAPEKSGIVEEEDEEEVIPVPTASLAAISRENENYDLPDASLLNNPKKTNQSKEHHLLSKNARKLENTLESFGVNAKVTEVHLGPSVTKYEVYPSAGVKVSKVVNLSDDLALALAAKDIRIEAPIPGKSAIGIEVPNQEVALVTLKEVLEAKAMTDTENPLAIALGRNISGEAVIAELNKMPHLLVAGATGSGKSVCINGIVVSILMRSKPHEVKLMMIDPKMVELNVYNGIPHLLSPVVTDPKKASQALKKVVSEMERRYELFADSGTRNIEGYNAYVKKENRSRDVEDQAPYLPFIVVIVDELADLMMVASSDVEDSITRLAQMARAAGIHLIIATQRPSVDVITGVIKANIPSRIAFGVSSQTDSRTILDSNGAEKLLGRGDMLFIPVGASKPTRIQGAFLSDEEVERIVGYCIDQQKAKYAEEMIPQEGESGGVQEAASDDLYDEAVALITEMQTASVSMLQRRFRIGYTRAARLIDEMEVRGVVGPYEGSKPREVLVSKHSDDQVSNG